MARGPRLKEDKTAAADTFASLRRPTAAPASPGCSQCTAGVRRDRNPAAKPTAAGCCRRAPPRGQQLATERRSVGRTGESVRGDTGRNLLRRKGEGRRRNELEPPYVGCY